MKDLVWRQDAIDAIKYWGLIDGLSEGQAIEILEDEEKLPSAQLEIIRCKDCKYYMGNWYCEAWNNSPGFPAVEENMFCSMGERKES